MFTFTPIVFAVVVSTAINIFVTVVSWRRKKARYGLYFALGMTGVTFWTLMSALDYAATPLNLKILFATLEGWGYMSAHPFFAMFAMSFAGYDWILEKKWVKAFFIFVPVTNILWVTTNNWHGLVWREFIQKADNVVVFVHGPAYGWIYASSNLLSLIIIASLALTSFKGSIFSRKQGRILLASILFTEGTNIAYNLSVGMEGVDWTSVAFSATGALFLWALYGRKFLDIIPIAREKLIDSLSDGMIVLDMQNRIVDVNLPAARMVGSLPEKLLGRNMDTFIPLAQALSGQPSEREMRTELEIGGAERRYYDILISPLFEGQTSVIGRLVIFRDITDRKRIQDELQKIAITDSLTGLFNRRHFFDLGEKEFAKSTRYNRSLSVILLDIDFFKGINDTYGHFVGDQVLTQVGFLFHKNGREADLTARYGGEEFIILLPETDCASAMLVAERLRKLIEESLIQIGNNLIRFTASFGVAAIDGANAETFDQLVSQADQALYEAKRVGRNRVACYREE